MTITATQHREERASLVAQMNDITEQAAKENRSMTSEERGRFDELDAAQAAKLEQAESLERVERVQSLKNNARDEQRSIFKADKSYGKVMITEQDQDLAFRAQMSHVLQSPDFQINDEMRSAANRCGINVGSSNLNTRLFNKRQLRNFENRAAQNVTPGGNLGGETVFYEMMAPLEVALKQYGGLRNVATVHRSEKGEPWPLPVSDDTANKGRWLGINSAVTNIPLPFDTRTLGAYKASSDIVYIPIELLQDSHFDVLGYGGEALGTRLGRLSADAYASETTGSGMPTGIFYDAALGKTTALTTGFTWQEILALIHSVDPAYRKNGSIVCHDTTWAYMKTITDSQGRPLWLPSIAAGAPDTFLGYQVHIDQSYPAFTTGTSGSGSGNPNSALKLMTFGDHSKYIIRDVMDINTVVLKERYADLFQIGLVSVLRTDARLICNVGREPIKYLQMSV